MSVEIARKFIQMRKFILENGDVLLALAKLQNRQFEFENETNRKFDEILKLISKPLDFGGFKLTYFDQIKLVEIDHVNRLESTRLKLGVEFDPV